MKVTVEGSFVNKRYFFSDLIALYVIQRNRGCLVVIDTSAILAILLGEKESQMIVQAVHKDSSRLISARSELEASIAINLPTTSRCWPLKVGADTGKAGTRQA